MVLDWGAVQEPHQDGGVHWHVFIIFKKRYGFRSPVHWDITTDEGTVLHPNCRVCPCYKKDLKYIWDYMSKTGNQIIGTWDGPQERYVTVSHTHTIYTNILSATLQSLAKVVR